MNAKLMMRGLAGLLAGACVGAIGCGGTPKGVEIVTAPPARPEGKWEVSTCVEQSGQRVSLMTPLTYYLERGPSGPVLYEFLGGAGSRLTNHWTATDGEHFFVYAAHPMVPSVEVLVPSNSDVPGLRRYYSGLGADQVTEEGGVKRPAGEATGVCPMIPM